MPNPYYNHGIHPATGSPGASAPIRSEYDAVAAGFALLPALTPANGFVMVNPSGTALAASAQALAASGSVTVPTYSFAAQTGSGMYLDSSGRPAISRNGTFVAAFGDGAGGTPVGIVLRLGTTISVPNGGSISFDDVSGTQLITMQSNGAFTGTAGDRDHIRATIVFNRGASSGASAALHLNPEFNFSGAQTGKSYGLGIAAKNTALNGSTQKLISAGTTTTDLYTGYTEKFSVDNLGTITLTDLTLARDGANILAQKNGANAQAFRVYGNSTQFLDLSHNGGQGIISSSVGAVLFNSPVTISGECLMTSTLTMTATASSIIPGTTSFRVRNNANSADNLLVADAGTVTLRNLLDLSDAAAGQIKFPAAQNASANVNTLDDYEEGTFTPALNFGGSTTGITYGTQVGFYTKIGNLVTFTINLVLTSKGAQTGAATITAMPFTSTNTSGYRAAFSIYFTAGATLTTNMLMVTIPANSTTLSLFDLAAAAAAAMDNTDFTNTSEVTITGSYRV